MDERFNKCLRGPSGLIDPYDLFFYVHSSGNEEIDLITFSHEVSGHGICGIDRNISLLILSSQNWKYYIDSIRNILEAIAYDEDVQYIKNEKIDPSLIDKFEKQENFKDIQEISDNIAGLIKLIQENTGITFSRREIYKLILHYWRIPFLSKVIKKDLRKITPSETIDEIKKIVIKLNKGIKEEEEFRLQLREALLKKQFKLLGHFDFPLDLIPFGIEIIMCFELFNETSKERRRAIFAHLLNALTGCASRGIYLPYGATDFEILRMLSIKMKYKSKDVELKAPLFVFWHTLKVYNSFNDQDISNLKSMQQEDRFNCGFNFQLAKIALNLKKEKNTSNEKLSENSIYKSVDNILNSFVLTHEACDLISIYLLNFSLFVFSSLFGLKQNPCKLNIEIDAHKQVIFPFSGSFNFSAAPEGYNEVVDSFNSKMQQINNNILRYFFMPELQMQEIQNELQKIVSKTELHNLKNITLENNEILVHIPFDKKTITEIEKCYKKVFEKNGDIFNFLVNFPKKFEEFNEIINQTANEYFCPEEICSEYILKARNGLLNSKSEVDIKKKLKIKLEKAYPDIHDIQILNAFNNL